MRFHGNPGEPEADPPTRDTLQPGGNVPDLAIDFTVRPPTVAAAVYGVMTVVSEHTSSLARLDDLRVALDELFYALPSDGDVRVELSVRVDHGRSRIRFRADAPNLTVHDTVGALVDDLHVMSDNGTTTAEIAVRHD